MSPTLAALLLIGIFVLAAALIWLGLGLSRRAQRLEEAPPPPEEPAEPAQLKALLAPYPSAEMACWPVSARVGSVKNNDPSLIDPIAAE